MFSIRVVEMVCRVAERVDFKLFEQIMGNFGVEPVQDHTAFDGTLGV